MRRFLSLLAVATAAAIPSLAAAADAPRGDFILDARLRYETVSQDGFGKDAQALTLRTRLGYETPAWRGFKALAEGENVVALSDRYNSTTNGKTAYPTVADPETTDINRLQVSYSGKAADGVVGRQRIILGNARFIGNVGFRQTEQTFDAVRLSLRPSPGLTLTYAYIDRVHRVFTAKSVQGDWDSDSHLVQAEGKTPIGQLTGYGYLLDFDNAPTQSSATWGARLAGSHKLSGALTATYEAEYARQSDYRNNPARFDLDYLDLGAGLKSGVRSASLGLERLDGNGRRGFQTPLATLHAFQGWADVFLTTPGGGVRDINLRAATSFKPDGWSAPVKLQAAAHDFADADGGQDYGREFDALVSTALNAHFTAELKAAFFDGASPAFADRTKVWVTLEAKY
ncbi:MAG TPA: hypothetical protein VFW47_04155 [Phenylobacterium sp.]|nr:hypothetical protein [Phenylobacterium sp.]